MVWVGPTLPGGRPELDPPCQSSTRRHQPGRVVMTTGWARSRFLETLRSAPSPEALTEPPQKLGAGREEGAPTARRGRRQDAPHPTSSKCGGGAEHAAGFSLLTQGPCHPGAGPAGAPPPPLTRPDAMVTSVLQEARSLSGDRVLFPPPETWGRRGKGEGRAAPPGGGTEPSGTPERHREEWGALGRGSRTHAESHAHTAPDTSVTPVQVPQWNLMGVNSSDRPPPHKNANSVPGRLRGHGKPRPFRTAPGPFCTGGRPLSGGGAWCGAPANCREGGWRAGPAERRAQDVNGRSRSAAGSGRAGGVSAGLGEQAPQTGRERVKAGGGQRLPRGPPPVTQPLLWTTLTPPQLAPKPEAEEAK